MTNRYFNMTGFYIYGRQCLKPKQYKSSVLFRLWLAV